jgi:DNA mismatch repair protein MutS
MGAQLTPMMQQYHDARAQYPGTLLLFRMGDFYELFHDDAETAARLLNITLTSRDKQVPMAGFPHHALDQHLRKLLAAGQKVAICEQMEDPALATGLVKREVVRVVTPGTLTEDGLLDPKSANHLAAVWPGSGPWGLAWVELSTGSFHAMDLPREQLRDELARLEIAECLWPEAQPHPELDDARLLLAQLAITERPTWTFDVATARRVLHEHFHVSTCEGFGFADEQPCLRAAGALLGYLQETVKASLVHLRTLQPRRPQDTLFLDVVTRRSLELTATLREGEREGSLLAALDRTTTAMGARLLKEWLLAPLLDRQRIEERLDAVAELRGAHAFCHELRSHLQVVPDLARLTTRATTGRANPRDLAALAAGLQQLPGIKAAVTARKATLLQHLEGRLELCPALRKLLDDALVDLPPLSPRDGGIIRPGYHAGLDELRAASKGGKEWMAQFQARECERTGISSLKVGFNKVFGYYIEITHAHAAKIPSDYQRRQTLKNAERYVTPELKTYEDKVLRAEEQATQLECDLFQQVREQVAQEGARLLQTAEVLARLDVLAGLAELADVQGYCRPEITEEQELVIDQGRHPVLDQWLPAGTFVPNDVRLDANDETFWLITGPNMAGKSTFIRQVAALVILGQMGSFVPAAKARIGLVDRIFTRVGASDELTRGQSTFMVEMTETANILNNASARSLVILDEIGRGTSTYDGLALAWAVVEHLHDKVGCRTLFATHYHELTQLTVSLPRLRNYNATVQDHRGEVIFLHRIAAGPADRSYGIHVAQLAGVPRPVLERARQVLHQLEHQHGESAEAVRAVRRKRRALAEHPSLFGSPEESPTNAEGEA